MVYHRNMGVIYVIIGAILLFLGLSKFVFHLLMVIIGLILVNAGLRMMGKPNLPALVAQWLSALRF